VNSPKSCHAYYYGGLPIKGPRRKGRLRIEEEALLFEIPAGKGNDEIHLRVPLSKMEKIFLTRDNNYGSDTDLLNLTFRDEQGKRFTLRFAPITLVPRRRMALQKEWSDYLTQVIQERPPALREEAKEKRNCLERSDPRA
jgi:hypothetical protein